MRFFDLHCDTLYRAVTENKTLNENYYDRAKPDKNLFSRGALFTGDFMPPFQLSFDRGKRYSPWIQSMAVWIPDDISEEQGNRLFEQAQILLRSQCREHGVVLCRDFNDMRKVTEEGLCGVFLSLENGRLIKSPESLEKLKAAGVKMITLTWNGENLLGSGVKAEKDRGLSAFGKETLRYMEKLGIAADLSHGSDRLFYEAAEVLSKPFAASHSNSRAVTNNPRNITDGQFEIIRRKGGLIGLNFSRGFLNNDPEKANILDVLRHAEHFLSLGGEDCLAVGSDFDGTDMPEGISGIESMESLYEVFLRHNYREELLDKLFFKNAYNFFENFDI